MKLATPIGALSGKSVQVSFPAVVSITAVGLPATAADLACDHNVSEDRKITKTRTRYLRMDGSLSVINQMRRIRTIDCTTAAAEFIWRTKPFATAFPG